MAPWSRLSDTHRPGSCLVFLIYIYLSFFVKYNILNFPARRGAHTMGHTRDTRHTQHAAAVAPLYSSNYSKIFSHDLNRTHLTPITPTRVTGAGGGAKSLITRRRPIYHLN